MIRPHAFLLSFNVRCMKLLCAPCSELWFSSTFILSHEAEVDGTGKSSTACSISRDDDGADKRNKPGMDEYCIVSGHLWPPHQLLEPHIPDPSLASEIHIIIANLSIRCCTSCHCSTATRSVRKYKHLAMNAVPRAR